MNGDYILPRRHRSETISPLLLKEIDQRICSLRIVLRTAQAGLAPLREQYNALSELDRSFTRALNVLNGRDAEYAEPHKGWMDQIS